METPSTRYRTLKMIAKRLLLAGEVDRYLRTLGLLHTLRPARTA